MADLAYDPRFLQAAIRRRDWHFHRRVHKVYGIVLQPGDFGTMVRDIENGRALMLQTWTDNTAIFRVYVRSVHEHIYIVVDGQRPVDVVRPTRRLRKLLLLRWAELGLAKVRVVKTNGRDR